MITASLSGRFHRRVARLKDHDRRMKERRTVPSLFEAVRARDVDAVRRLLAAGANPRLDDGRETPLHAAARTGPLALVEALIEGDALEWQPDRKGRLAVDVARRSRR